MKKNANKQDHMVAPFHQVTTGTLSAGVAGINVRPNDGNFSATRLAVLADAYAHFRVRKLRFRLHPVVSVTASQAVGYVGGVQDTSPSTVSAVGELISSTPYGGDCSVPSSWVIPTKEELAGPFPWYKSIAGSADTTEEQPGQIIVAGNASDAFILEIEGVLEFKVSVSTANTPAQLKLLADLRELRQREADARTRFELLRALSVASAPAPLTKGAGAP
jgi:hypothetical protein